MAPAVDDRKRAVLVKFIVHVCEVDCDDARSTAPLRSLHTLRTFAKLALDHASESALSKDWKFIDIGRHVLGSLSTCDTFQHLVKCVDLDLAVGAADQTGDSDVELLKLYTLLVLAGVSTQFDNVVVQAAGHCAAFLSAEQQEALHGIIQPFVSGAIAKLPEVDDPLLWLLAEGTPEMVTLEQQLPAIKDDFAVGSESCESLVIRRPDSSTPSLRPASSAEVLTCSTSGGALASRSGGHSPTVVQPSLANSYVTPKLPRARHRKHVSSAVAATRNVGYDAVWESSPSERNALTCVPRARRVQVLSANASMHESSGDEDSPLTRLLRSPSAARKAIEIDRQRIEALRRELSQCKSENVQCQSLAAEIELQRKDENKAMQLKLDRMESQLAAARERESEARALLLGRDHLSSRLDKCRRELETEQRKRQRAEDDADKVQATLVQHKATIVKLSDELDAVRANLEKERNAARDAALERRTATESWQRERNELAACLADSERNCGRLAGEVDKLHELRNDERREHAAALASCEEDREHINGLYEQTVEQCRAAEHKAQSAHTQLKELQHKCSEIEVLSAERDAALAELQQERRRHAEESAKWRSLQVETGDLRKSMSTLTRQSSAQMLALREDFHLSKVTLQSTKQQLEELQQSESQLRDDFQLKCAELSACQERLVEAETKLGKYTALEQKYKEACDSRVSAETRAITEQHSRRQAETERDELRAAVEQGRDQLKQLQDDLVQCRQMREEACEQRAAYFERARKAGDLSRQAERVARQTTVTLAHRIRNLIDQLDASEDESLQQLRSHAAELLDGANEPADPPDVSQSVSASSLYSASGVERAMDELHRVASLDLSPIADACTERLENLQHQLDQAEAKLANMEAEVSSSRCDFDHKLSDVVKREHAAQQKLSSLEAKLALQASAHEEQLQQYKEQLEAAQEEAEKNAAQRSRAQEKCCEAMQQAKGALKQLLQMTADYEKLKQRVETADVARDAAAAQRDQLQQQLDSLQCSSAEEVGALQRKLQEARDLGDSKVAAVQSEVDDLKLKVEELTASNATLTQERQKQSALQSELDGFKKKMESKMRAKDAELKQRDADLDEIRRDNKAIADRLDEKDADLQRSQQEVRDLREQLSTIHANIRAEQTAASRPTTVTRPPCTPFDVDSPTEDVQLEYNQLGDEKDSRRQPAAHLAPDPVGNRLFVFPPFGPPFTPEPNPHRGSPAPSPDWESRHRELDRRNEMQQPAHRSHYAVEFQGERENTAPRTWQHFESGVRRTVATPKTSSKKVDKQHRGFGRMMLGRLGMSSADRKQDASGKKDAPSKKDAPNKKVAHIKWDAASTESDPEPANTSITSRSPLVEPTPKPNLRQQARVLGERQLR